MADLAGYDEEEESMAGLSRDLIFRQWNGQVTVSLLSSEFVIQGLEIGMYVLDKWT